MIDTCKRLAKDRYFLLSVIGLCFIATPVVLGTGIESLLALTRIEAPNVFFMEAGRHVRSILSTISRSQNPVVQVLMVGIGFVLPGIGIGMVLVAWLLMLKRRLAMGRQQRSEA